MPRRRSRDDGRRRPVFSSPCAQARGGPKPGVEALCRPDPAFGKISGISEKGTGKGEERPDRILNKRRKDRGGLQIKNASRKPWRRLRFSELVRSIGQQSQMTSSLDRLGQLALMHSAGTRHAAGQDLGPVADIFAQLSSVFIVDVLDFVHTELANLSAAALSHGPLASCFISHCGVLLVKFRREARCRRRSIQRNR